MRNYTLRSAKYIAKNFWYLLPFAVLPAFFLSMSLAPEEINCVVTTLMSGRINELHFYHLFSAISVLNFASWESIIYGLIGIVVLVVCVSLMMALLEKHMRIGKRTFFGIFSKLNDNLIPTAGYTFIMLIIYEVWSLLTAVLVLLSAQIPVVWLAYTLVAIFFIFMHLSLIYVLGLIYLWLPCMQITGFHAGEAFQYSYHLMSPVKWGILGVQAILLFAVEGVIEFLAVISLDPVLFTTITTALYTVLLMIYCVRMEVAYFDRENITRADLKRKYY
ncbi:MAG: hypothetical protein J6A63_05320 [Clostridia bacterium]|nr:hypothetical protein [Clostridia bacterium]